MLVATTRKQAADAGELYTGERGTAISLNSITVSIPPDGTRKVGEVQWPKRLPANPQKEFAVADVEKIATESQARAWFRNNRNAKKQVIIFVHGFNNTYADAVFRFAQIAHDAGTDAAPILFTWPSRASAFGYLYDKESTNYSRRALEDIIMQTANSPDVGDITILAHSMGTWLAVEALRGVAMREKMIPAKVKNVVLASPDIDVDVFRRQLIEMGQERPQFTIFASTKDRALEVSRWISGGVNRVGGIDAAPYASVLKQLGITVIDTSTAVSKDALGHNAFADSPEIIGLLGKRLAGQSLEGGSVSLTDHLGIAAIKTADFAGSAARTIVAAPIAVVSPEARKMLEQGRSGARAELVDGEISY
ncbi:alpha/beta hydrolase [Agrobacterium sp. MS2]|nr:alpha/beta hydrolase [Agrobacterium sp. MS2]